MLTYSVAIRTLGLAHASLWRVLEGVLAQSVRPREVIVYIAEGAPVPVWRVANERYVRVERGMVRQRALPYDEITADCIMMLDDDLLAGPETAERLLREMERGGYDLIGADMFRTHRLPTSQRLRSALSNLTLPHRDRRRGFVMRRSGSFSYPSAPVPEVLPSDTCGGPLMMWRATSFRRLDYAAEVWLDGLGFAYGDDALLSYKATANGMKVGVDFGANVENLDSRTASARYREDPGRFHTRAKGMAMTWWRMHYRPGRTASGRALLAGLWKGVWMLAAMTGVSVMSLSHTPLTSTLKGMREGIAQMRAMKLPPYIRER